MIILKILAVWLLTSIPAAMILGRFLKAAESQEHARIKNAAGGDSDRDEVILNHFGDVL